MAAKLVVLAAVLAAGVFLGSHFYRVIKGKKTSCPGCGASGCHACPPDGSECPDCDMADANGFLGAGCCACHVQVKPE